VAPTIKEAKCVKKLFHSIFIYINRASNEHRKLEYYIAIGWKGLSMISLSYWPVDKF